MLKTIEQKLRDQERQAIINADQESARSLQRFVKKTLPRTPDELKEQEIMKPYAKYTLDNKYLNFEKSIQQAYIMIDQGLPFDGFNNVISAYNELVSYLNSIVKYNSLSQSMKVPIDEKMNKLNSYLKSLISNARISGQTDLFNLKTIQTNIENKIYKSIDINDNLNKVSDLETMRDELTDKVDNLLPILDHIQLVANKGDSKKKGPADIEAWKKKLNNIKIDISKKNITSDIYRQLLQQYSQEFNDIYKDLNSNRIYVNFSTSLIPLPRSSSSTRSNTLVQGVIAKLNSSQVSAKQAQQQANILIQQAQQAQQQGQQAQQQVQQIQQQLQQPSPQIKKPVGAPSKATKEAEAKRKQAEDDAKQQLQKDLADAQQQVQKAQQDEANAKKQAQQKQAEADALAQQVSQQLQQLQQIQVNPSKLPGLVQTQNISDPDNQNVSANQTLGQILGPPQSQGEQNAKDILNQSMSFSNPPPQQQEQKDYTMEDINSMTYLEMKAINDDSTERDRLIKKFKIKPEQWKEVLKSKKPADTPKKKVEIKID